MKNNKKMGILMSITILTLIFSTIQGYSIKKDHIWLADSTVLEKKPQGCWWLDGYRGVKTSMGYSIAALNLNHAYYERTSKVVREHLSQIFVNPYNNTVFVVVKNLSDEVKNEFLSIMKPANGVHIVFMEGVASLSDLEKWCSHIVDNADNIEELGVRMNTITINELGYIEIGIESINSESVNILNTYLDNEVPSGILVLYEKGLPTLTSQSSSHRPVIGGILVESYSDVISGWNDSTMGFYVTWNSGSNQGVLIAGHASSDETTDVHQPERTNKIGDVHTIGNEDYADVALVELDGGISGSPEIYSVGIDCIVTGEKSYNDVLKGDDVELCGITSGIETCEIEDKSNVRHPIYGILSLQLILDYETLEGDSGGPLYQKFYEPSEEIYTATAYGTVWGKDPGIGYANSITGIEDDLGVNLDFADS